MGQYCGLGHKLQHHGLSLFCITQLSGPQPLRHSKGHQKRGSLLSERLLSLHLRRIIVRITSCSFKASVKQTFALVFITFPSWNVSRVFMFSEGCFSALLQKITWSEGSLQTQRRMQLTYHAASAGDLQSDLETALLSVCFCTERY